MHPLRLIPTLLLALTTALPAAAGPFDAVRAPLKGSMAQADKCGYDRALDVLAEREMRVIAEVPRTDAQYRFVVAWKSDSFAVTVRTTDCRLDVVDYADRVRPYCDHLPGVASSCPRSDVRAP
ncbi:MAG TPA: hypothetical protein VFE52_09165 [Devosia sp.]|jgi:hypothetical protein|nr:hypothetical protein [Devosia sp.]